MELDTLQYSLDEGPCVDSLVHGSTIVAAPNIRTPSAGLATAQPRSSSV